MNEWQVFERGIMYQVGRWYRTPLLRRWKIEWHGWLGYSSDLFTVFQTLSKESACSKAIELNEDDAKRAAYKSDHWKPVSCD